MRANLNGRMVALSKASLKITIFTGTGFIFGMTAENLLVIGFKIRCMDTVFSPGQTAESIRVTTQMTKNMVTEYSSGQMEEGTKANGRMASSTELECGKLILFPSHMEHWVNENTFNKTRHVLAMNFMPDGETGFLDSTLTY